jgi:hypothetical protein
MALTSYIASESRIIIKKGENLLLFLIRQDLDEFSLARLMNER